MTFSQNQSDTHKREKLNNKGEINQDSNYITNKETTILQSPFIMSKDKDNSIKQLNEFITSTPLLLPQKRKHSSPIKRHRRNSSSSSISFNQTMDISGVYSRNRKPLAFSNNLNNKFKRTSSLLDDFQHGDPNETIDLFSIPTLLPPQNSKLNDEATIKRDSKKDTNNRNFFDFNNSNSSLSDNEANLSIFSLIPTKGSASPFDFNSYLRSVTSNLQMVPKIGVNASQDNSKLLDLSNTMKLDVLQESDRSVISNNNLLDHLELDCVVRSSAWDSDIETEDELDLNLNLNLNSSKDMKSRYNINDHHNYTHNFNQKNFQNSTQKTSNQKKPITSKFSIKNDISSFAEPVNIFSDSHSKIKSPVSSQGSDETLQDDEINHTNNNRKRVLKFSTDNDIYNDVDKTNENRQVGNKCSPHHHIFTEILKPSLKPIPKTLLNLIVESSDGSLDDATKYATEINAQNSEGIPIPEKTTELVNIPTTAPTVNGIRKSAIVRGVRARTGGKRRSRKTQEEFQSAHILGDTKEILMQQRESRQNIISNNEDINFKGFYSLQEKQQFTKNKIENNAFNCVEDKENIQEDINGMSVGYKRAKTVKLDYHMVDDKGKKRVNWAETLEW